jgi:glyoxylase I family protein
MAMGPKSKGYTSFMPSFSVLRIDHVVLRVADLERSIRFYGDVIGCEVAKRNEKLGLIHLRAGTAMIDLVSLDGKLGREGGAAAGREGRNVDHFCLRIEPFDESAILAHLDALGVEHSAKAEERFGAEGDGPSIYFQDPDGNTVELKGPST